MAERADTKINKVVVNHDEQYSNWPVEKTKSTRLGECRKRRAEGRLFGLYQGSVDRHETAELEKKMAEKISKD